MPSRNEEYPAGMRLTKIICTLGPATNTTEAIEKLIAAGMNVARINLSHGTMEEHRGVIRRLKQINEKHARSGKLPTCISILLDTKGAEVRTSTVKTPLSIHHGEEVVFSPHPLPKEKRQVILVDHKGFAKDAQQAEVILLDNGKMGFTLTKVNKDGSVVTRSNDDGTVGSRRHVNLPGANLDMPSLTKKDWQDIALGAEEGVDFLGLSFVREAKEVEEVRAFLQKKKKHIGLVAKIETRQAVENMKDIIAVSDGIMVARGDLGAEVPFERMPVIQDDLVFLSRQAGKPVIVATHMLESMIENPMPTRAEVTDIAHAAMIGTDVTMLSGETANGKYPVRSLEAMVRVLKATEEHLALTQRRLSAPANSPHAAQADAAVSLALSTDAKAIVAITKSGQTAREIARYRPYLPLIACTPDAAVQRALQLSYGTIPLHIPFAKDPEKTVLDSLKLITKLKLLKKGDSFVLISDAKAHDAAVSTVQVRKVS